MAALQLLLRHHVQYTVQHVCRHTIHIMYSKMFKSMYICIYMCPAFTFILNHLVWIFKTKFSHH